jgi:phosphohistidine swiveling domain-containing protein
MQETWFYGQQTGLEKFFGKNPFAPINVYYLVDGAIEVWNNNKAIMWLKDKVLEKNKSDPSFLKNVEQSYEKVCGLLKSAWLKGYCETQKELSEFIKNSFEANLYFVLWYYPAMDKRTPKELKAKAFALREKDTFFDDTDRVIRNSIKRLWSELDGFDAELLSAEIQSSKMPPLNELKKRKVSCVMIPGIFFDAVTLEEFSKANKNFIFQKETALEGTLELKGSVAFDGKVNGRVKLLRTKDKVNEVMEGEVLIAAMTVPDFLPAMKKAVAFVTDEGGIICHAAITARELKKPCIVGTKFATQIFKDGDIVEVDAECRTVRLIKKKD